MSSNSKPKGAPKHQNEFAFRHNPKSRKTKKILGLEGTTDGLCPRCQAIIEWRKKFRKYKPLKSRRHCNGCAQKAVGHAYHHLCQPCAADKQQCAKCQTPRLEWLAAPAGGFDGAGEDSDDDGGALPSARAAKAAPPAAAVAAAGGSGGKAQATATAAARKPPGKAAVAGSDDSDGEDDLDDDDDDDASVE